MNRNNNNTPAKFKAGDAVLCPSIGNSSYTLYPNGSDKDSTRLIIRSGDDSHGFYRDGRVFPNDALPSLFLVTEANRQAIATLYSGTHITQTSQRNVIDTTTANDDEVILLTSGTVSNAACEVHGAAEILNDISSLLGLIYSGKINQRQAVSLARMAQVTTDTWSEILYLQLAKLNEPLSRSKFGAMEVNA